MCSYWVTGKESFRHFPGDKLEACVENLVRAGLRYARLNGGEPTLHPRFADLVGLLASRGVLVEAISNGSAPLNRWSKFVDAGLSRIQLSIDGIDSDTVDRMRGMGGAFEQTHAVLSFLSRRHPDVYISLNCVLTGRTFTPSFLNSYTRHFSQFGVKRVSFSLVDVQTAGRQKKHQMSQGRTIAPLSDVQLDSLMDQVATCEPSGMLLNGIELTLNPYFPRHMQHDRSAIHGAMRMGVYGAHIYAETPCIQPWTGMSITHTGDCYPCLNTVHTERYNLGNMLERDANDIFNGCKMQRYREGRTRSGHPLCMICKDHQQLNCAWKSGRLGGSASGSEEALRDC